MCPQMQRCGPACVKQLLFDGPSDGVEEDIDEAVTGRGAHAGEHGVQASGSVGVRSG